MKSNPPSDSSIDHGEVRRGVFIMVVSVIGFTVNTLLLRYLSGETKGISPDVPLLFRAGVGIFVVLVFFRGRRPTRVIPVFRDRLLMWRGLSGLLGTAAYYWTVPSLGAGTATLICNTYVIFASIIASLALGEKLTPLRFLWLILAFIGIVFLLSPEKTSGEFAIGFYECVALAGAVIAATSVVLVRRLVADYSIGTIYLSQCIWIFLPVVVMAGPKLLDLEASDFGLLVLGGLAASYGQLAMNEGYRCLSVSAGASMQMLWPVMTTVGGWWLFSETLSWLQLSGAVIILYAVWRVSRGG
ncbi:MAG: DMT family transporter [Verrucomicrobiota bacterium]